MIDLVAHRGYARHYPENTLVALEAAVAAGAQYVEVDVQMTSDGVPVLFHDQDCVRLCGAAGAVSEYALADMKALRAAWPARFGAAFADNPVASLQDFVGFLINHPTVTAFVEIKRQGVKYFGAEKVVEEVRRLLLPVFDQTVLLSFSLAALKVARPYWPRIGLATRRYCEFAARAVCALSPEYHFCDLQGLPKNGAIGHAHSALVVYEVDDAVIARELGARGAALIETFAIGEMRTALQNLAP